MCHMLSRHFIIMLFYPADAAASLQSCPTLCDPTDGSPPGSSVPGILQARILEWVAISFSQGNIFHGILTKWVRRLPTTVFILFFFFGISWGYIINFEKHLKLKIILTHQSWPHYTPIQSSSVNYKPSIFLYNLQELISLQ